MGTDPPTLPIELPASIEPGQPRRWHLHVRVDEGPVLDTENAPRAIPSTYSIRSATGDGSAISSSRSGSKGWAINVPALVLFDPARPRRYPGA